MKLKTIKDDDGIHYYLKGKPLKSIRTIRFDGVLYDVGSRMTLGTVIDLNGFAYNSRSKQYFVLMDHKMVGLHELENVQLVDFDS